MHATAPLDTQMLRRCIELSRQATRRGENPFACIICDGDRIVAETTTRAARDGDITRHAEMIAISEAQHTLGTAKLAHCAIYSNVEPCAMCAFCIRETGIRRVVYSIASPVMGGCSKWNILGDAELSDALPEVFAAHRPRSSAACWRKKPNGYGASGIRSIGRFSKADTPWETRRAAVPTSP